MKTVGLYIGRFQPFHIGHLNILERMNLYNDDNYCLIVRGKLSSQDKNLNPFSKKVQCKVIKDIKKKYELNNIKFKFVQNGYLTGIIKDLDIFDKKSINLYIGRDRISSYDRFFELHKNLVLNICDFNRDFISGTNIRKLINENELSLVQKYIPYNIDLLLS